MRRAIHDFDMRALSAALDERRRARSLSWAGLAAEINAPFAHTPSIPINVATLRGMAEKRSVTSAVVLQVLRWLGRSPESFLSGRESPPAGDEALPDPGPMRILRFDTRALHADLDAERRRQGKTWKQVASELAGFSESMLTNLASGPLIGFPRVMALTQWLEHPAARYVRSRDR